MSNATLDYLTAAASLGSKHAQFVLDHGRAFEPGPLTFKGKPMVMKQCFANSAKLVLRDPSLTYVEGYVTSIIPIHHAWVMRPDGGIIDPTLRTKGRIGDPPHDYFGVPFSQRFLFDFLRKTRTFGLLGGMSQMSIDLMTGKTEPTEFLAANAMENAA